MSKKTPISVLLTILLIPTLSGCKYGGSFMQMDSNSHFPFFGLTLAVDSGSRPPDPAESKQQKENSPFDLNLPDSRHAPLGAPSWDGTLPEDSALVRVRN